METAKCLKTTLLFILNSSLQIRFQSFGQNTIVVYKLTTSLLVHLVSLFSSDTFHLASDMSKKTFLFKEYEIKHV